MASTEAASPSCCPLHMFTQEIGSLLCGIERRRIIAQLLLLNAPCQQSMSLPRFTPLLHPSLLPAACPAGPPPPHCPNSPLIHWGGEGWVESVRLVGILPISALGTPARESERESCAARGAGCRAGAAGTLRWRAVKRTARCACCRASLACFPHALHPQSSRSRCSSSARVLDDDCSTDSSSSFVSVVQLLGTSRSRPNSSPLAFSRWASQAPVELRLAARCKRYSTALRAAASARRHAPRLLTVQVPPPPERRRQRQ